MRVDALPVEIPEEAPEVWLLDGTDADEQFLRASARRLTEEAGARYASRSYRYPYALVAWHSTPVGIDIERVQTCERRFAASICTPAEEVQWTEVPDPHIHFSSLWSSKEALAKALGNPLGYDPRRLSAPLFWPGGRAGRWKAQSLSTVESHVAWMCWRCAG